MTALGDIIKGGAAGLGIGLATPIPGDELIWAIIGMAGSSAISKLIKSTPKITNDYTKMVESGLSGSTFLPIPISGQLPVGKVTTTPTSFFNFIDIGSRFTEREKTLFSSHDIILTIPDTRVTSIPTPTVAAEVMNHNSTSQNVCPPDNCTPGISPELISLGSSLVLGLLTKLFSLSSERPTIEILEVEV